MKYSKSVIYFSLHITTEGLIYNVGISTSKIKAILVLTIELLKHNFILLRETLKFRHNRSVRVQNVYYEGKSSLQSLKKARENVVSLTK